MLDKIALDNFRVENIEDLDDMTIDSGTLTGTLAQSMRANDRSHHAHAMEISGRKEDKDGLSQDSKKQ